MYLHCDTDDSYVCHCRMLEEQRFQFCRGHLVALDLDQFLQILVSIGYDDYQKGLLQVTLILLLTFIRSTTWNLPRSST